MRKTEMIEEALSKAERRAASTGSGGNEHNAIRQNLRGVIDSPKKSRMFSKQELAAINDVVMGTKPLNALRLFGKLSPEGNGLMMFLSGGLGAAGALTNPLLALPPVVGFAAKRLGDRGMQKSVERLLAMVSSGQKTNIGATWMDVLVKARTGAASEGAIRMTAAALARQLARETGEDENGIMAALVEAAREEMGNA
jgi:hypothetical protein